MFNTLKDFLLVLIGFGFIIFIHELGHFVAARWAGIRVLAFAIGFGPALFSYRKGLGLRGGSSHEEYLKRRGVGVSPTEYRLNALPFGGYVKMLGQDDADPTAVSDAPDSYQSCVPWKKLIVISAGVIMNVILAAILFVIVFTAGMQTEPAVLGGIASNSAASRAVLDGGEVGLKPGDRVLAIDGERVSSFNDISGAVAMAKRDTALRFEIERGDKVVNASVTPGVSYITGLLEIGAEPARTLKLFSPSENGGKAEADFLIRALSEAGLKDIPPGSTLESVNGQPVKQTGDVQELARRSNGAPLVLTFADDKGERRTSEITPEPEYTFSAVPTGSGSIISVEHLLGLSTVVAVREVSEAAAGKGLEAGDIIALAGGVEFPSALELRKEVGKYKGKTIPMVVLRKSGDSYKEVRLSAVAVGKQGTIGIGLSDKLAQEAFGVVLSLPVSEVKDPTLVGKQSGDQIKTVKTAAAGVFATPGTVVSAVGMGTDLVKVENFHGLWKALRAQTAKAAAANEGATVTLTIHKPSNGMPTTATPAETVAWALSASDVKSLHALSYRLPPELPILFEPMKTTLKANGPVEAIAMGTRETKRVMLSVYTTFARLTQGTIKVEHLKGPVGIAHLGTLIADRGTIWLLFFLAMISVNLAVVNFLPLPIVDGGQFLFILYEQIRGKPVPVSVQNGVTIAGLALIGTMFLIVTYNDIRNLLGF